MEEIQEIFSYVRDIKFDKDRRFSLFDGDVSLYEQSAVTGVTYTVCGFAGGVFGTAMLFLNPAAFPVWMGSFLWAYYGYVET